MTVSYAKDVATCRGFSTFLKLLFRWRASIYKLVWKDLLIYLGTFYLLTLSYSYLMNDSQKYAFEVVVFYCTSYTLLIPLSFVLGFYVKIVMERWWGQYMTMPWPDPIAVYVSSLVVGQDEHGRLMRRTIMRYVCLCHAMVFTLVSPVVKKRFPTLNHLVDAGMLLENERDIILSMDEKFPNHPKHWMPIVWAASIILCARKEGRIRDDFSLQTIIEELDKFRRACTILTHYDTISIPLVYTQVVTIAVYTYFLGAVMSQQWTDKHDLSNANYKFNSYVPFFPMLEFFFYMGWLKVAESLICPFGEDDDDFEVNWLIDRNLTVCYLIVDEMHHEHPELVRDQYWDEVFPNELPYPTNSEMTREGHPRYSAGKLSISRASTVEERDATVHYFSDTQLPSVISDDRNLDTLKNDAPLASNADVESEQYGREVLTKPSGTVRIIENARRPENYPNDEPKPRDPENESEPDEEKDEFDQLRDERERERNERQMQRIVRTFDTATTVQTELGQEANVMRSESTNTTPKTSQTSIASGEGEDKK